MRIISVKKDYITKGLENLICFIQESNNTEELLIVFNDDFWWRLFWIPDEKKWRTTIYQKIWKNGIYLNSSDLIKMIEPLKYELERSRGFEYKTYREIIVFQVENMVN